MNHFAALRTLQAWTVTGILLLVALMPIKSRAADQLLLTLTMVEYSYPAGRTGTIRIYSTTTASPFASDPSMRVYNTGLWAVTDWTSLGNCSSSFLAGGHQQGWLLGPETNTSSIRSLHPTANVAYGVITGVFGDTGWASRYNCSGGAIVEQYAYLYAFLLPQSTYVAGQGYHVGDVWYSTDYSPNGNWYYLYSSTPL